MDLRLVYAKTPIGDEAVRQSTRVVHRNLRMVLVQVDGKLNVEELSAKIGNPRLVENALRDLEKGGFIAPTLEAASVWEESKRQAQELESDLALSQFSTFGASEPVLCRPPESVCPESGASSFSSFGKPILPTSGEFSQRSRMPPEKQEPLPSAAPVAWKWRRWLLAIAVGAFLLLALLVVFYPYHRLKPAIEGVASHLFQAPVQVAEVGVAFWPQPVLKLSSVRIGENSDSTISQIRLASPLALLGFGKPVIARVDLVGASFSADRLTELPLFSGQPQSGAGTFQIRKIVVDGLSIRARDGALRELSGELSFKDDGRFEKAILANADRSMRINVAPGSPGILLDIEAYGWKPLGGKVSFDILQAKGLLQKGSLRINNLDTTTLGGVIKGSWLLDWSGSNGFVMSGSTSLSHLDCRKIVAALAPSLKLDGELTGSLRLRSAGSDWEQLLRNTDAVFDGEVKRGILYGADLAEAVRRGAGYVARAGSTKFDSLRLNLTISPSQVLGRDLRMTAGMVTATGQFVAAREQPVNANLLITMKTSVSTTRTAVQVTGPLSELVTVSR